MCDEDKACLYFYDYRMLDFLIFKNLNWSIHNYLLNADLLIALFKISIKYKLKLKGQQKNEIWFKTQKNGKKFCKMI